MLRLAGKVTDLVVVLILWRMETVRKTLDLFKKLNKPTEMVKKIL